MEISPSDIADRYTIVRLKIEMTKNNMFRKEYDALEKEIKSLKKRGLLKSAWISELYSINSKIWVLEGQIGDLASKKPNFRKIGTLAMEARKLNSKRTDIKCKISKAIRQGFLDEKMFYAIHKKHPSKHYARALPSP
jgi:hypothetical protein